MISNLPRRTSNAATFKAKEPGLRLLGNDHCYSQVVKNPARPVRRVYSKDERLIPPSAVPKDFGMKAVLFFYSTFFGQAKNVEKRI